MAAESITFLLDTDGRVTADRFPKEIEVFGRSLEESDGRYMRRDGSTLIIDVANGFAEYELGVPDPVSHTRAGYLIYVRPR